MRELTIQDAVDFVLLHRTNKVFKGQSANQIAAVIQRAMDFGLFLYVRDTAGRLLGLCVATPNKVEKTLRVNHILCVQPHLIPSFLTRYRESFIGFTITAWRHGREVAYNTAKLVRRLERT